jgi:hypothetical protein
MGLLAPNPAKCPPGRRTVRRKIKFWIKLPGNFVSGPAEFAPCIPEKWVWVDDMAYDSELKTDCCICRICELVWSATW